ILISSGFADSGPANLTESLHLDEAYVDIMLELSTHPSKRVSKHAKAYLKRYGVTATRTLPKDSILQTKKVDEISFTGQATDSARVPSRLIHDYWIWIAVLFAALIVIVICALKSRQ
ncbi:MAG: hypothetical protein ACKVHP_22365, partial [Verrucomicrobiales bacterium]